jgi:hypothetical protein
MRAHSETSLEAYHTTSARTLQAREQQLMAAFKGAADTFTRQELVDVVGMPLNAVCGRANSLVAKKVLCVRGFAINPGSGKRREKLGLFIPEQLGLFQ